MNIVVCVKQVPDSWADNGLRTEDATVDRDSAAAGMNELDEFAVEEALKIQERNPGESTVSVLTMGPAGAADTIRKALSMGADAGIHVLDDSLHGSDALTTSLVLAKALGTLPWDLVICGTESTDSRMAVVPAMLAERLGAAQLTMAGSVEIDASTVRIQRQTDAGWATVEGHTPAVVSVIEKINEPRYPSFKNILASKKRPVTTLSISELGLLAEDVGLAGSRSSVVSFAVRPAKQAGIVVRDEGDGGLKVADFLSAENFI